MCAQTRPDDGSSDLHPPPEQDRPGHRAVTEWRIHIGAHKTATTHLQETLAACRDRLSVSGDVDFIPMSQVRRPLQTLFSRRRWQYHVGGQPMRRDLEAAVERLRGTGSRIALSEENILGSTHALLTPVLYPRLERQVGHIATLSASAPLTLFVSIRSFDAVLSGAYVTALRFNLARPQMIRQLHARIAARPPSWVDLLARIRAAAPDARLRVWQQESYRTAPDAIAAAFLGCPLPPLPDLPPPAATRTPSAQAVARVEAVLARAPRPRPLWPLGRAAHWAKRQAWTQEVNDIYAAEPADADHPKFTLFSAAQTAALRDAYQRDIDTLRRDWPGTLIDPQGDMS